MRRISLTPLFHKPVLANRLVTRKLSDRDAGAFADAFKENDYEMRSFFIFPPDMEPDKELTQTQIFPAMKRFETSKNMHYLGVFRVGAPENMVGMVICNQDQNNFIRAGYFIKASERRKGYASEMYASLMEAISRRTPQSRMVAEVDKGNTASLGLLRSLGFGQQGIHFATNNRHDDRKMIALTRNI